jgi:hypothetical protein
VLASVCWLLSGFEDVYRADEVWPVLRDLFAASAGPPTVRRAAHRPTRAGLRRAGGADPQAEDSGSLAELRDLAGDPEPGQPLGVAAPVVVQRLVVPA